MTVVVTTLMKDEEYIARKSKARKPMPFEFVLDQLESLNPITKPMFGCTAVYVGAMIVLVLREKSSAPKDNGVWLATTSEHHESLSKEFPSMRSIGMFGGGPTGWQNLPADSPDFEESAMKACELILKRDSRIGKIPARKKTGKKARTKSLRRR
jgi:hypothetical protein